MKKIEIIFKTYDVDDNTLEPLTKPLITKDSIVIGDICQIDFEYFVHLMSEHSDKTLQQFIKEIINVVPRISN